MARRDAAAVEEPWAQSCLLGSATVSGRPGVPDALESCGGLGALLSLFAAAFSLPVSRQLPVGSRECDGEADAREQLACLVLRLITSVVGRASFPDEGALGGCGQSRPGGGGAAGIGGVQGGGSGGSEWSVGRGADGVLGREGKEGREGSEEGLLARLVSGVSYVCLMAPSATLAPSLVGELAALVAACHSKGAGGGEGAEVEGRKAAVRWLLQAEVWAGRSGETLLEVARHVHVLVVPLVREQPRPLPALLDLLLDTVGAPGGEEEHALDAAALARGGGGGGIVCPLVGMLARRRACRLSSREREALVDALMHTLAASCAQSSPALATLPPRAMSAADFDAIGHCLASLDWPELEARVLWFLGLLAARECQPAAEEQEPLPISARPKGWTNMLLHAMSRAPCMLAALYNLVLYMASLPQHHQV